MLIGLKSILRDEHVDGAPAPDPAPEVVEEAPETTPEQQELARLKAENAELKNRPAPAPAQNQVTLESLEKMTNSQWEVALAEIPGNKTKEEVLQEYRNFEFNKRQNKLDAKTNTTEALQDAIEANPKLIRLRGTIKEYMNDVPDTDKLDPAKLKRHMEIAITYAKGKHMTAEPQFTPKPKANDAPNPNSNDDGAGDEGLKEGEIKDDIYTNDTGLRIKTGKVDKKVWAAIQHKTREPNSIQIPSDFDKPPVFGK